MKNPQPTAISGEGSSAHSEARAGRYLTFTLSEQDYGIGILSVREIIALQDITPLPGVPDHVEGVINLRGRIIPVIDLRVRLEFEAGGRTERTCIIVTEVMNEDDTMLQVGFIVDAVSEVLNIEGHQIEATPELGPGVNSGSILGLAKLEDCSKVISLLDIHRLVDSVGELALNQ